jgi:hypothetical protein
MRPPMNRTINHIGLMTVFWSQMRRICHIESSSRDTKSRLRRVWSTPKNLIPNIFCHSRRTIKRKAVVGLGIAHYNYFGCVHCG